MTASPIAGKKRGRNDKNSIETSKDQSTVCFFNVAYNTLIGANFVKYTYLLVQPKASAALEVPCGVGLEPKHFPPSTAAAIADEDGFDFLMKAVASFPTQIADQSLSEEDDTVAMGLGLSNLTDKDKELLLPFVHHFGWIVGPLPADNPFLEGVREGCYLSLARFLHEVASLNLCNADAVSVWNLQKYLKTMAETVKLKENFVSFISQYLDKMLVLKRVKTNAALVRTYEAKLSEAKKAAAESEVEYNKPWQ